MAYRQTGAVADPATRAELESLQQSLSRSRSSIQLQALNVVPTRLAEGLTVFADGTNWNPGSGKGVYTYYTGAWHKLG